MYCYWWLSGWVEMFPSGLYLNSIYTATGYFKPLPVLLNLHSMYLSPDMAGLHSLGLSDLAEA